MSQNLIWSLGLLVVSVVFLLLEFFIPSAGMLGVGAVMALLGALFLAYSESLLTGLLMTGGVAIGLPILLIASLRAWPHTPIGRRILNLPPEGEDIPWQTDDDHTLELKQLVGRVGTTRTNLLPSGMIEIDGRRFDAVAQGVAIDKGQHVEVFSVEAGKIRVRPTNRHPMTNIADRPYDKLENLPAATLEELNLEELGDPLS